MLQGIAQASQIADAGTAASGDPSCRGRCSRPAYTLLELPLTLVAEDAQEGLCIVELLHSRDFDPGA